MTGVITVGMMIIPALIGNDKISVGNSSAFHPAFAEFPVCYYLRRAFSLRSFCLIFFGMYKACRNCACCNCCADSCCEKSSGPFPHTSLFHPFSSFIQFIFLIVPE